MNIPPDIKPGQILVRNEDGEWVAHWPSGYRPRQETLFLFFVFSIAGLMMALALYMLWTVC